MTDVSRYRLGFINADSGFHWTGGGHCLSQRFEPNQALLKIERDPKVPQEIAAQNATLSEARSLVYRVQIKDGRVDAFATERAEDYPGQNQRLHVVGDTRCSEHSHPAPILITSQILTGCQFLRDYRHAGAGIDDEVERLFNSL